MKVTLRSFLIHELITICTTPNKNALVSLPVIKTGARLGETALRSLTRISESRIQDIESDQAIIDTTATLSSIK